MPKERLDQLIVARGFADSREAAQRLIRAGSIRIKDQLVDKPGHRFDSEVEISCKATARFVSRGGDKLEGAFEAFDLDVSGKICMDVGASTGGFTDCLLQHGAAAVYAVDVGKGQLHWKLRTDERVTVFDKVNARNIEREMFPEPPAFACVDVSFISLTKVLPAVIESLSEDATLVTLIKPQFEAGRDKIGKGGVVRDSEVHTEVLDNVRRFGEKALNMQWLDCCQSPLKGPAGNIEFLAFWSVRSSGRQ